MPNPAAVSQSPQARVGGNGTISKAGSSLIRGETDGDKLITEWRTVTMQLANKITQHPQLIVEYDEESEEWTVTCPRCDQEVDRDDGLRITYINEGSGWNTYLEDEELDNGSIVMTSDDDEETTPLYFYHEHCGAALSLPSGWSWSWA
jgi:hypothetical protein